jgi:hypothetical protein
MLRFLGERLGGLLPAAPGPLEQARSHWERACVAAAAAANDDGERGGGDLAEHLNALVQVVADEEADAVQAQARSRAAVLRGPCLELVLEERVPEAVASWGVTDRPPGARDAALAFFAALLTSVRQPLLPERAVRDALNDLLAACTRLRRRGDDPSRPKTQLAHAELLVVVVRSLVEHPAQLALFFLPPPMPLRSRAPVAAAAEFPLLMALLDYVDARGRLGLVAREGVLLLTLLSHGDAALAAYLAGDGALAQLLAAKLADLYCALPTAPSPVPDAGAAATAAGVAGARPRGSRALALFLDVLKFADQLVEQAGDAPDQPLAQAIAQAVETTLLRRPVREALMDSDGAAALTATWHIVHCLRTITTHTLAHSFAVVLASDSLALTLVQRMDAASDGLALATVALFDALLGLFQPVTLVRLVLRPSVAAAGPSRLPGHDDDEAMAAAGALLQAGRLLTLSGEALPTTDAPLPPVELPGLDAVAAAEPDAATPTTPLALPSLTEARSLASNFLHFVWTGDVRDDEDVVRRGRSSGGPPRGARSGPDAYFVDAEELHADFERRRQGWLPAEQEQTAGWWEAGAAGWTADGPLLRMLLDCLGELPNVSFERTLLLTSCIAKLAQWPGPPCLRAVLFQPDSGADPATNGLYSILVRVATELRARVDASPHRDQLCAMLEEHRLTSAAGTVALVGKDRLNSRTAVQTPG